MCVWEGEMPTEALPFHQNIGSIAVTQPPGGTPTFKSHLESICMIRILLTVFIFGFLMVSTHSTSAAAKENITIAATGQRLPADSDIFSDAERLLFSRIYSLAQRHGHSDIHLIYFPLFISSDHNAIASLIADRRAMISIIDEPNPRQNITIVVAPYLIVEAFGHAVLEQHSTPPEVPHHMAIPFSAFQRAANSYQATVIGQIRSPQPDDALRSFQGTLDEYSSLAGLFLISPQTDLVPFEASAQTTIESCARASPDLLIDIFDELLSRQSDASFDDFRHLCNRAFWSRSIRSSPHAVKFNRGTTWHSQMS
jgi:hypothetical protein